MPTRTLRLDPRTGCLKLQQSSVVEPYAALTYCWGGDQPHKLTRSNQQDYEIGIDIQRLPATIQDTIRVAADLGISHVWIDSMCIVQDDPTNVAMEIAKMPEVYGHAAVTISASRASRVVDGFLEDIDSRQFLTESFQLRYKCPNGSIGSTYLIGIPERSSLFSDLYRRGWTLQERCLSPRLLDYGKLQMRWVCDSSKNQAWSINGWKPNEEWPSGNYDVMREVKASLRSDGGGDIGGDKMWILAKWGQLVETYTDRDLTVTTDRILAISALAQEFGDVLYDEYLAGIWRCALPWELLWCQASEFRDGGGAVAAPRPEQYQGPSWSWVAVNGPVIFLGELSAPASAAVTHVEVRVSEPAAKYGAVEYGVLGLRGRLRTALWDGGRRLLGEDGQLLDNYIYPDALEVEFSPLALAGSHGGDDNSCQAEGCMEVSLLEVSSLIDSDGVWRCNGLVLRIRNAGDGAAKPEYSRLGLFQFSCLQDSDLRTAPSEYVARCRRQRDFFDGLEPVAIEIW